MYILLILSFTSSLALLFTSNRWLLIMLSFAHLLNNTVARCLTLETADSAVKRLILFNSNLAHLIPSLRLCQGLFDIFNIRARLYTNNFKKSSILANNV